MLRSWRDLRQPCDNELVRGLLVIIPPVYEHD